MITIDYTDKRPIYEQLIDSVEDLAAKGFLQPGDSLPSVRQLAMDLSINPNTIQRAYQELENRGVICSVKGKGTFLSRDLSGLVSHRQRQLLEEIREGLKRARVLEIPLETLQESLREIYEK